MFRRDFIELGSAPVDEDCIQVEDSGSYMGAMVEECQRYKEMLQRIFPDYEDYNCTFSIKSFDHDFGAYYEVVIWYYEPDEDQSDGIDFALFVESNLPDTWEDIKVRTYETEYQSDKFAVMFE